jgi:4-amino-4-deoxy-L-arabinose transferase-like glycosyltransferase
MWYYPVIICLIAFPLFYKLGSKPIRLWDESRLAVNAWEMYHNNHWIVTHFGGKPEMWNTKPPLMIWAQVVSMKVFGMNEFALRFPSALAALITCIVLISLLAKYFGKPALAIISVFILITSEGYSGHHVTRTGDYDSLLILFMTLYCLYFYLYLETNKIKNLYLAFLFIALSVLTKSVAGILFLPALFIYVLVRKQLLPLLTNKHFYFGTAALIGLIASYYVLRESQNQDIFRRFSTTSWAAGTSQQPRNTRTASCIITTSFINNLARGLFWLPQACLSGISSPIRN